MTYKVLWVDDELSIVDGLKQNADELNIELDHYENWFEAKESLQRNFEDYSAIILDAKCKISSESSSPEDVFITTILPDLLELFGRRQCLIPWYILSAGTMSNFDFVIKTAQYHHKSDWGQMVYLKDATDDENNSVDALFNNIMEVARNNNSNKIIYNYRDVFQYIGKDKLIDYRAKSILLDMLNVLYYPEDNKLYKYEGNPLRKVMEYVFRAALKIGLLPKECVERDDQINMLDSNRYMSGLKTEHSKLRYGTKDKDTIFPNYLGQITRCIINFSSSESHTADSDIYTIDDNDLEVGENEKELFFGYVLQLCHVIKWFGTFAENHQDIEANKRMKKLV